MTTSLGGPKQRCHFSPRDTRMYPHIAVAWVAVSREGPYVSDFYGTVPGTADLGHAQRELSGVRCPYVHDPGAIVQRPLSIHRDF